MKKILLFISLLSFQVLLFAQQTNYDLANFIAPKGWKKADNNGVLIFNASKPTGQFCIISIYKSVDGTGSLIADFESAWKELVADRLGIKDPPSTEKSEPENGWESETGSASFTQNGATALALLTTMSGYNKAMSILVISNDQSYNDQLTAFYNSITMNKPTVVTKPNNALPSAVSKGVNDYIYSLPKGWTKEVLANEIVLHGPDKASVISMLPMQASSGDLEQDMQRIFWQVFDGWEADKWNPDHHIYTKGKAAAGWNYYKQELGIAKPGPDGKNIQAYGFVFLASINNQVAIIAGSYVSGNNLLSEAVHPDWVVFFQHLGFKNYKSTGSSLPTDILGNWLTGSNSGVVTYTFAANGHFEDASAFSTSHDISQYRILEKTTSFVGDGTYSIKGNELTTVNAKTHIKRTALVRVFFQNQYGQWLKKIGMLEASSVNGELYEITLVPNGQ